VKIILVAAARPNFMKIAPLMRAIKKHNASSLANPIRPLLVHTGQHYDYEMSQVFFEDLDLPAPDIHLGIGSGSHAGHTGKVMIEFEKVLLAEKPDLVVVVGDVNSTLAAALAAVKLHLPVAHVEAGVRTGDRGMPEEINRLLTDHISDYLFTTSKYDDANLKKEGIPSKKIFLVGNIMADSIMMCRESAQKSEILQRLNLTPKSYALLTLHRPANVDDQQKLELILSRVQKVAQKIPIVFPAHPRTQKQLNAIASPPVIASDSTLVIARSPQATRQSIPPQRPWQSQPLVIASEARQSTLAILPPLGYRDMLALQTNALFVITDSGGIQVETTVLGIPCLTVMDHPVWRITHKEGTNTLVGSDCASLEREVGKILNHKLPVAGQLSIKHPQFWDGKTADRIIHLLNPDIVL
jgi:UDP-N-acetylglucosamine 2-epimerase (non-hydrolysing)